MAKPNLFSVEIITQIKRVCTGILREKNFKNVQQLKEIIEASSKSAIKIVEPAILSSFYPILKDISNDSSSVKAKDKELMVDTLKALFDKIGLEESILFFNIYGLLLSEIYDIRNHKNIPEEYKLSIVECTISLTISVSPSLVNEVYTKENSPKFGNMLYVLLDTAKNEQLKPLRLASMKCIMAIVRILSDDDFNDLVTRHYLANIFMFFLPGIAIGLMNVALSDEKVGHKIPAMALECWGKITTMMMQDYDAYDQQVELTSSASPLLKKKWGNQTKFDDYLKNTKISPQWYQETDSKLRIIIGEFSKLTHHSHCKVRLALIEMCSLLTKYCIKTMPSSMGVLIEIVITLSEDENSDVASVANRTLFDLSSMFSRNEYNNLLESLEDSFFNAITSLPRKFNSFDETEQLAALNLIDGYINLFDKHNLTRVLHSNVHLNQLMTTLIHISELDKSHISLLEEFQVRDFETIIYMEQSWKKFHYFKDKAIERKIAQICCHLTRLGGAQIASDFLLDAFITNKSTRKETIYLLNNFCLGMTIDNLDVIKNVVNTFTEPQNWYLPLQVTTDDQGYEINLGQVQSNIVEVCLLVEGLGNISIVLGQKFDQFMLKTLYLVLERAGSGHPIIRSAGLSTLNDITKSSNYKDIPSLINLNNDYFSFHVERKLNRKVINTGVLNVLAVVMKYSSIDVLKSTADIIQGLLIKACNRDKNFNVTPFLQVFRMFIYCLHNWLEIKIEEQPIKTKREKLDESEEFHVSGIEEEKGFSDEIMGKTAEELYNEDLAKGREQVEADINESQDDSYKKPEPPMYIKLAISILSNSLHFLPSKDKNQKLLVLEILTDGVEVIKDWEDELLPIVHQIWSPLVSRFKEIDYVIVNYSFKLLVVLARLSKEFIRDRTEKEVLPTLLATLQKLAKDSYLKDKGSAYRFSQGYKLQLYVLENLGRVSVDLDLLQKTVTAIMEVVYKYLSDKQPIPLQEAAVNLLRTLELYDPTPIREQYKNWSNRNDSNEFTKNLSKLLDSK